MSRKRIHIDKLFKDGLKNFSLLVTDKDFDAIDDKASVFKDTKESVEPKAFEDFELEITDADWLATKAKFEQEKNLIEADLSVASKFSDFEITPDPGDWPMTYSKYKTAKRKRSAFWWWLSTGIIVLVASVSILLSTLTNRDVAVELNPVGKPESSQAQSTIEKPTNIPVEGSASKGEADGTAALGDKKSGIGKHAFGAKEKKTLIADGKDFNPKNNPRSHSVNLGNQAAKDDKCQSTPKPGASDTGQRNTETEWNESPEIEEKRDMSEDIVESSEAGALIDSPVQKTIEVVKSLDENAPKDSSANTGGNKDPKFKPMNGFYLGMVNQMAYTHRVLSNSNSSVYNSIRNRADKGFVQYTFGLEFGYLYGKNKLNVGINSTKQTWTSDYKYAYQISDSIPVYDRGVLVGYLLPRKRDTTMNESRTVTMNRIEIPVSYSRNLKLSERVSFDLGLGAVLGFTTKVKGDKILYPENKQLYYYHRWEHLERRMSFAPSVDLGVRYRLGGPWLLQTNFTGNIYAFSRFKKEFDAGDYPYSLGLNFKLIYLLNPQKK